jgi:hypothetical protein
MTRVNCLPIFAEKRRFELLPAVARVDRRGVDKDRVEIGLDRGGD